MKYLSFIALFSIVVSLNSCQEKIKKEIDEEVLEVVLEGIDDTSWQKIEFPDFNIEIPNRMRVMENELGEEELEYGFVQKTEEIVYEHYLTVTKETKSSIDSLNLDYEFDIKSYSELSVNSFNENFSDFLVYGNESEVEKINGMDAIIYEIRGTLPQRTEDRYGEIVENQIGVYYKFGIFEGEKSFYHVLTWCISSQQKTFKTDMEKMIRSFVEKT